MSEHTSIHRPWTQQERCKRCMGSVCYPGWAHCTRMNLLLNFDGRDNVRLSRDNQAIMCDGAEWNYKEVSDG